MTTGRHRVRWMFHSTAMVADYDSACARLARLAGLRVLEYSAAEQVGRRGGMTWIGDNSLEIGSPLAPDNAVGRFVQAHGGGMHSVALQVEDLEATVAHLESRGVRVAARPGPGFCFTDPRDTGGIFLEWADLSVPEDPRMGAPLPDHTVEALLNVTQHAFVGALAEEPLATARRLAELTGTGLTFEDPGAGGLRPVAGLSVGDCTLALYRLSEAADPSVWGRPYTRPRTHLLGLRVEDLVAAADRAVTAGFPVIAGDDQLVLLDPAGTGGVQVGLVERLLPGDPRG